MNRRKHQLKKSFLNNVAFFLSGREKFLIILKAKYFKQKIKINF